MDFAELELLPTNVGDANNENVLYQWDILGYIGYLVKWGNVHVIFIYRNWLI